LSPPPQGAGALAPFRVRSFRFQWPADLATSWAFEMEALILGWYVLVETGSVTLLTVYASLQYLGTLVAPLFGVAADRIGHRNLLSAMRGVYTALAALLTALIFLGALTPAYVLLVAAAMGVVRPSDVGMRIALAGETMPPALLMGAMGVQRTTQDSARIAGALSGAGLVVALGMGPAYLVVTGLYGAALGLTLQTGGARAPRPSAGTAALSAWGDLKAGVAYVWTSPVLLAVMLLAFLLNLTAFPQTNSLLPVVARQIYGTDQTGLGYMVASVAAGSLVGSLAMSRHGGAFGAARAMLFGCLAWYAALFFFARTHELAAGLPLLVLAGCAQSVSQVPMMTVLLRSAEPAYRGRVMGIRMLALYGNVPGLLAAGPLIAGFGYPGLAAVYCGAGVAVTLLIAARWRRELWQRDAQANAH
jgi:MFS family permease